MTRCQLKKLMLLVSHTLGLWMHRSLLVHGAAGPRPPTWSSSLHDSELGLTLQYAQKITHPPVKLLFSRSGFTGPTLHTNSLDAGLLPSHAHLTAGESCEQPLVRTRISVTLQSRTECSCTWHQQSKTWSKSCSLNMTLEELF